MIIISYGVRNQIRLSTEFFAGVILINLMLKNMGLIAGWNRLKMPDQETFRG